jgi:glycosyltransferase involved in cell wall biosynthesis
LTGSIKISVVIPAFNRAKTIGYALRSVLDQTYPTDEILVVDDCSTDNTIEVVEALNDPRIKVIRQPKNFGAQAARNKGIREAKNEWIALHDSDDEWMPNRLEVGVKALESTGFDPFTLVHSNCIQYYEATGERVLWELPVSEGPPEEAYKAVLKVPGPMFQGMLTSKAAFEKIGYLDEKARYYQEWDTSIRLAKYCRFVHIREPLFIYYFHSGETISGSSKGTIIGFHYSRLKHKDDTVKLLGKDFYDWEVRWNIQRAFDSGNFALAASLIQQTYHSFSRQGIYLATLAALHISPRQLDKYTDPLKSKLRAFGGR